MRMRHEDVHFEKKKFLTNSGRKKSAPSQRDPPAKIVIAKFLYQNDSKRLYVVSLHCWRWLSANKHVVQICRSSLSAAADDLADSSGERQTWPVNGNERSLSCAVVPKTKFLPFSATTFPTALLHIVRTSLAKGYPLSKLLSIAKAEPLPFEKEQDR